MQRTQETTHRRSASGVRSELILNVSRLNRRGIRTTWLSTRTLPSESSWPVRPRPPWPSPRSAFRARWLSPRRLRRVWMSPSCATAGPDGAEANVPGAGAVAGPEGAGATVPGAGAVAGPEGAGAAVPGAGATAGPDGAAATVPGAGAVAGPDGAGATVPGAGANAGPGGASAYVPGANADAGPGGASFCIPNVGCVGGSR